VSGVCGRPAEEKRGRERVDRQKKPSRGRVVGNRHSIRKSQSVSKRRRRNETRWGKGGGDRRTRPHPPGGGEWPRIGRGARTGKRANALPQKRIRCRRGQLWELEVGSRERGKRGQANTRFGKDHRGAARSSRTRGRYGGGGRRLTHKAAGKGKSLFGGKEPMPRKSEVISAADCGQRFHREEKRKENKTSETWNALGRDWGKRGDSLIIKRGILQ